MADNEKLDNQRLKNFKNKGRDLEVKVTQIRVEDLLFLGTVALFAASFAPWLPCDVVSNFHRRELCTLSFGQGLLRSEYKISALGCVICPLVHLALLHHETVLVMKHVREASQSSSPPLVCSGPPGTC